MSTEWGIEFRPGKGAFVLSLDTELAWGMLHRGGYAGHELEFERTRYVVERLLELLVQYNISATWAVVGKLLEEPPVPGNGAASGSRQRPEWWRTGEDHYWSAPDIVEKILACPVPQEIGCHTYTHMIMGTPGADREALDREIKHCRNLARRRGVTLRSFVYPRNVVSDVDVLEQNGFTAYRGVARSWAWRVPGIAGRVARVVEQLLPVAAPVTYPTVHGGIVDLPASTLYLHRNGWAKYLPIRMRVRKSIASLHKAALSGGLFHLWTHPFNLASDPDGLLNGLARVFQEVNALRDSGLLVNHTMAGLAAEAVQFNEGEAGKASVPARSASQ